MKTLIYSDMIVEGRNITPQKKDSHSSVLPEKMNQCLCFIMYNFKKDFPQKQSYIFFTFNQNEHCTYVPRLLTLLCLMSENYKNVWGGNMKPPCVK